MLFVRNKDDMLQLCIYYSQLNKITIKNKYPLPWIDDLFHQGRGENCVSQIDLWSGYQQIWLIDEDIYNINFRTRYGNYEFIVLPFGLTNAPVTCMSLMHGIFYSFLDNFFLIFIDDTFNYSKSLEEHKENLRAMLDHNLYETPRKCDFYKN